MRRIDRTLTKILAVSCVVLALSVIFPSRERRAPKPVLSALLSKKRADSIRAVEIQRDGGRILLKNHGEFWVLSKQDDGGEITTCADKKIISSLITNFTNIIKMYKISDSKGDFDSFFLRGDSAASVSFLTDDDNVSTKIYFGDYYPLTNRIVVSSDSSGAIYEAEDSFHQYLTTDINYWSEGRIIAETGSPVQISFSRYDGAAALSPVTLDEKSDDFRSVAETLLSLRHGSVLGAGGAPGGGRVSSLVVQGGGGRIARLDFFAGAEREDEVSYFYTKSVVPSEADPQETRFALYSESAVYEISGWTYERILGLFQRPPSS